MLKEKMKSLFEFRIFEYYDHTCWIYIVWLFSNKNFVFLAQYPLLLSFSPPFVVCIYFDFSPEVYGPAHLYRFTIYRNQLINLSTLMYG
jgi:hypothetical protein